MERPTWTFTDPTRSAVTIGLPTGAWPMEGQWYL